MVDLVTVGWLTTDDIVLPDGTYRQRLPGGGALYSAVGSRIWNSDVGIHSVTGQKRVDSFQKQIGEYGIDPEGIYAIPGGGLELWLLHESGSAKQQVPWLSSASADEMDRGRGPLPETYAGARGYHIAPQSPEASFRNLHNLTQNPDRTITMDLLVDPYIDASFYKELSFLEKLSAFLPSREEVDALWKPEDLVSWVAETSSRYGCTLAVKLSEKGSIVKGAEDDVVGHVPAYPVSAVDTTGAGDAYCGGFLAGLVQGRSALECAAMGTVSASFVVEVYGALDTRLPSEDERETRFERVMQRAHESIETIPT